MASPRWKWRESLLSDLYEFETCLHTYNRFPNPLDHSASSWFPVNQRISVISLTIRKLIELDLADPGLIEKRLEVFQAASLAGAPVSLTDWGASQWVLDNYDVERAVSELQRPYNVASEIMHSMYLFPIHGLNGQVRAISYMSKKFQTRFISIIPVKTFREMTRNFGRDQYDTVSITSEDCDTGLVTRLR